MYSIPYMLALCLRYVPYTKIHYNVFSIYMRNINLILFFLSLAHSLLHRFGEMLVCCGFIKWQKLFAVKIYY